MTSCDEPTTRCTPSARGIVTPARARRGLAWASPRPQWRHWCDPTADRPGRAAWRWPVPHGYPSLSAVRVGGPLAVVGRRDDRCSDPVAAVADQLQGLQSRRAVGQAAALAAHRYRDRNAAGSRETRPTRPWPRPACRACRGRLRRAPTHCAARSPAQWLPLAAVTPAQATSACSARSASAFITVGPSAVAGCERTVRLQSGPTRRPAGCSGRAMTRGQSPNGIFIALEQGWGGADSKHFAWAVCPTWGSLQ